MKWGIIGASDIASTRVIPAMREAGHEVVAVISSNKERAIEYAATNALNVGTDSLADFLALDIDAVYISTTNEMHALQAIAAAKAGKHILCEKPISVNVEDAKAMISQARASKVVFATNHHIRTSGVHQKIRELIATGAIGEVYLARINHAVSLPDRLKGWRIDSAEKGAGVVLDITVHNVDTLRAALGSDVVEVTALTTSNGLTKNGIEDTSNCVFRFANGVIANTIECFLVPYSETSFEIHGSKGSLVATGVMTQDPIGTLVLRDASGVKEIEVSDRENLYVKTIRQFDAAVAGKGEPLSTGEDGFASMQAGLAVLESAKTKRTISVEKVTF